MQDGGMFNVFPPFPVIPCDDFGDLGEGVPLLSNEEGHRGMQQPRERIRQRLHPVIGPGPMLEESAGNGVGDQANILALRRRAKEQKLHLLFQWLKYLFPHGLAKVRIGKVGIWVQVRLQAAQDGV